MKTLSPISFTDAIAFLFPGFVMLYALRYVSPFVATSLDAVLAADTSEGALALLLIVSLIAGMLVSVLRAQLLDTFHQKTGVGEPDLDRQSVKKRPRIGIQPGSPKRKSMSAGPCSLANLR